MHKYAVVLRTFREGNLQSEITIRTYDDAQRAQAEADELRKRLKQKSGSYRTYEVKPALRP